MTSHSNNDILAARIGYALHQTKDLFTGEQLDELAKAATFVEPEGSSMLYDPKTTMTGLESSLKKFIQDGQDYMPESNDVTPEA